MQIVFFSEYSKTVLSEHKIHFIYQRIQKLNFYFAFFVYFQVFKTFFLFFTYFSVIGEFDKIHRTIQITPIVLIYIVLEISFGTNTLQPYRLLAKHIFYDVNNCY